MAEIITDSGNEWVSRKVVGDFESEELHIVAVGTGTTSVSPSDTSLDNEIYRTTKDDDNCSIAVTSDTGSIQFTITLSGGTEVPAGSDIAEIAVITNDGTFVWREVRTPVNLASGDRKTFENTITFQDG